jgi:hypothetical protein
LAAQNISLFLCEWSIRDRKHHYIKEERPKRESLIPEKIVIAAFIDPENVMHLH